MQVVLVMFRSDGERRSFSIVHESTIIGRREDCDVRIPLSEVSRRHCRLIIEGESLRVEDAGSSNGTFHNGKRVQEAPLSPGDAIRIGPVTFLVQIDGVPADEDLKPPETHPEPEAVHHDAGGQTNQTGDFSVQDDHADASPVDDLIDLNPDEEATKKS